MSRDANEMQKHAGTFNFIPDTVSAKHAIHAYLVLLARDRFTIDMASLKSSVTKKTAWAVGPGY